MLEDHSHSGVSSLKLKNHESSRIPVFDLTVFAILRLPLLWILTASSCWHSERCWVEQLRLCRRERPSFERRWNAQHGDVWRPVPLCLECLEICLWYLFRTKRNPRCFSCLLISIPSNFTSLGSNLYFTPKLTDFHGITPTHSLPFATPAVWLIAYSHQVIRFFPPSFQKSFKSFVNMFVLTSLFYISFTKNLSIFKKETIFESSTYETIFIFCIFLHTSTISLLTLRSSFS